MPTYNLNQVFGVHIPPPEQTYVDRAGLDERMRYFLDTGRHLVIFGPSKQGKTALRQRALPNSHCIIVQCRHISDGGRIFEEILGLLGVERPTGHEISDGRELGFSTKIAGSIGAFFGKAEAEAGTDVGTSHDESRTSEPIGHSAEVISFVAQKIRDARKRVIIEDFHYIPETAKGPFAKDLKALLEHGVPFVLIGAWEDQHALVSYNGDLSGRIDEINLRWTDDELRQVLLLGQEALNIEFSPILYNAMVQDASGNVGLLQRMAEKICIESSCFNTQTYKRILDDLELLEMARYAICQEEAVRYRNFGWSVTQGFAKSTTKTRNVYMRIVQVCVEALDQELFTGLFESQIIERIIEKDSSVNEDAVKRALRLVDSLQKQKSIYPIIATFNPITRKLHLADRELLFYRKYGGPHWPWDGAEEDELDNE